MNIKVCLHSTLSRMYDVGSQHGLHCLNGPALHAFAHALSEVEFDLEVDADGTAKIVAVDGRRLTEEPQPEFIRCEVCSKWNEEECRHMPPECVDHPLTSNCFWE